MGIRRTNQHGRAPERVDRGGDAEVGRHFTPVHDGTSISSQFDTVKRAFSEIEREYLRGVLSRDKSYRLLVSGDIGPKELGKMIKLLQAQKAILEDEPDKEGR